MLMTVVGVALDLPVPADPAALGARIAVENILVREFLAAPAVR